ncbi:FecR family protein [Flavivirga spongiicola]|uniref:FecR family protein n=1 Tax=Flavivirga spongiicola TaxID=421621 RepID=A0ABU7XX42_9FLAO|nr:FecR family protein [Flavivirga sp. MEBiC05379]MDO5980350.1 FecR family protein [Flavivirga sp. MEBiC05379]
MQEREIIKYLTEKSSKSEQKKMEDWITASQENAKIFNEQKALYVAATFDNTVQEIDIEEGYIKFTKAIKPKPKYYKYAVAASIILMVGLTIFLNRDEDTSQFQDSIIVNNQIQTGTDKAILTLENGEEVTLIKGNSFQTPHATSNGKEITYNNNTSLELVYNYLTVPRGGKFHLTLSDSTEVWLNSESQLKYPVSFTDGNSRQVELVYGEAYFDVSSSTNHKGADFKVFHNKQEVEVLGTEFNIKAYKDETNIYTTLVEGKVVINAANKSKVLSPTEQANLDITSNSISITTVNVYNEISWKDDVFSFNEKSLKEIMVSLSRWYDMEVVFENKSLEEIKFVGVLRKHQSIEEILTYIMSSSINNYEIHDKTIILK